MDHSLGGQSSLIGVGIYTPADAARFTGVGTRRIARWLCGYQANETRYPAFWQSQIQIGDGRLYLGFRDLTEIRVIDAFVKAGLSPNGIRRAIHLARDLVGVDRPLSTERFRTDGKRVFLLLDDDGSDGVIDLINRQYGLRRLLAPSFKGLVFDDGGEPRRWEIATGVVLDPLHAFGQPVDRDTLVPTDVLAAAAVAEGSAQAAARAFDVPLRSVQRAIAFEQAKDIKHAA